MTLKHKAQRILTGHVSRGGKEFPFFFGPTSSVAGMCPQRLAFPVVSPLTLEAAVGGSARNLAL